MLEEHFGSFLHELTKQTPMLVVLELGICHRAPCIHQFDIITQMIMYLFINKMKNVYE